MYKFKEFFLVVNLIIKSILLVFAVVIYLAMTGLNDVKNEIKRRIGIEN